MYLKNLNIIVFCLFLNHVSSQETKNIVVEIDNSFTFGDSLLFMQNPYTPLNKLYLLGGNVGYMKNRHTMIIGFKLSPKLHYHAVQKFYGTEIKYKYSFGKSIDKFAPYIQVGVEYYKQMRRELEPWFYTSPGGDNIWSEYMIKTHRNYLGFIIGAGVRIGLSKRLYISPYGSYIYTISDELKEYQYAPQKTAESKSFGSKKYHNINLGIALGWKFGS